MSSEAASPDSGSEDRSQTRPGTNPSAPSASRYAVELPYAEELEVLLAGRYKVESFLGQGGMGAVYKGLQMPLRRPVAIKILAKVGAASPEEDEFAFEERFKREAYAMAELTHPNIVQVYDCGDAGENFLFISMELVEGGDLSEMIKVGGVTPEIALGMIGHICNGLQAAHERGLVHRDIKPANIFLTIDGRPKVADFGLAKKFDSKSTFVTKTGLGMGTPDYAAPEQYEGVSDIDHRADIYALGVMFYQMLTGILPRGAYKPPSQRVPIDHRIDGVVAKAMEESRDDRYQSVAELKSDIDTILATWMQVPAAAAAPMRTGAVPTRSAAVPTHTGRIPTHTGRVPTGPRRTQMPMQSAPPPPPPRKSGAGVLIGVLGAIVIAAGAWFFLKGKSTPKAATASGVPASATAAQDTATSAAASAESTSSVSSPAPASAPVPLSEATWVSVLPGWWGDAMEKGSFSRVDGDAAKQKAKWGRFIPVPASTPPFRDQASRAIVRLGDATSDVRVCVRMTAVGPDQKTGYSAALAPNGGTVRLGNSPGPGYHPFAQFPLPAGFDAGASHTLELSAVGDLLTVSLDGVKMGEYHDSQYTSGHPEYAAFGEGTVVEKFEYAVLDPPGSAPVMAESPSPSAPTQPGDVLRFAGHRYQLVPERCTWFDADAKARAMGGHLATITSREENEWMKRNVLVPPGADPHVYLGARKDKNRGGAWMWSSGEPVDLALWGGNGPDGSGGPEGALTWLKYPWDDVRPDLRFLFLVEWDDAGPAPALQGVVDLLAQADLSTGAVKGTWGKAADGLLLSLAPGPQIFEFQFAPPEEYDFEIEFTPKEGSMEAMQVVPKLGRTLLWKLGCGGGDGMRNFVFGPRLDGLGFNAPGRTEARSPVPKLKQDVRYRSLLQVRKDSVRALFDDKEVLNWKGDFNRFEGEPGFGLKDASHLAIGAWGSGVTFHKAELRPATAATTPIVASTPSIGSASAPAPAPPSGDPHLAKLEAGFRARFDSDAQQPFLRDLAKLNKDYLASGVARARAAAASRGDAVEMKALDQVKARVLRGEGVPDQDEPGTPESLKSLRGIYRTAYAKLVADRAKRAAPLYELYVGALDAYVVELTKADSIPEARKVAELRDRIAAERDGLLKALPPPTGGTAEQPPAAPSSPPPDAPPPPAASSSPWRRAAEAVLARGGSVVVLDSGRRIQVKAVQDLPSGKFDIIELAMTAPTGPRPQIKDADLAPLVGLHDLQRVNIQRSGLSDTAFAFLADNKNLNFLAVDGSSDITDALLAHLEKSKGLRDLTVRSAKGFTGAGLATASFRTALKSVQFIDCGISDEGLKTLATCEGLVSVNLLRSKITDEGVASLQALRPLIALDVEGTPVSDKGIEAIAAMTGLKSLNVEITKITRRGLMKLAALPNLASLRVRRGNPQISAADIEEFQKAAPQCTVK